MEVGLPWPLQAVASSAAQTTPVQPATRRALRTLVVNMEIKPSQLSRFPTDNRKRVKGGGRYTPFGMKLTVPAGYGRFGDERGRLTLVRPASAIPGPDPVRPGGPGGSGGQARRPADRGARGPAAELRPARRQPPPGQVALAGIPHRLRDGVVRRTGRTD